MSTCNQSRNHLIGGRMEPSVANLVGMLSILRPDALRALAGEFPEASNVLRPGTILGDAPGVWKARLAVAHQGLESLRPLIHEAETTLYSRLATASRLELGGAVVGAVGSASVLTTVLGGAGAQMSAVAAAVALSGSLVALTVRFMRRDVFGVENALQTHYGKLRDADWQSKVLLSQLAMLKNESEDRLKLEENATLIREADALAGSLYRTLKDVGIPVRA